MFIYATSVIDEAVPFSSFFWWMCFHNWNIYSKGIYWSQSLYEKVKRREIINSTLLKRSLTWLYWSIFSEDPLNPFFLTRVFNNILKFCRVEVAKEEWKKLPSILYVLTDEGDGGSPTNRKLQVYAEFLKYDFDALLHPMAHTCLEWIQWNELWLWGE